MEHETAHALKYSMLLNVEYAVDKIKDIHADNILEKYLLEDVQDVISKRTNSEIETIRKREDFYFE